MEALLTQAQDSMSLSKGRMWSIRFYSKDLQISVCR